MCHAGELRVYNEKQLVSTTKMPSPVGAMVFGRYGREEHALISILTSGAPDRVQQGGSDNVSGWEASCHCCGMTHTSWCQAPSRRPLLWGLGYSECEAHARGSSL